MAALTNQYNSSFPDPYNGPSRRHGFLHAGPSTRPFPISLEDIGFISSVQL